MGRTGKGQVIELNGRQMDGLSEEAEPGPRNALLCALAAVRGTAQVLARDWETLSSNQRQQLLSVMDDESTRAIELVRSATVEANAAPSGRPDRLRL